MTDNNEKKCNCVPKIMLTEMRNITQSNYFDHNTKTEIPYIMGMVFAFNENPELENKVPELGAMFDIWNDVDKPGGVYEFKKRTNDLVNALEKYIC